MCGVSSVWSCSFYCQESPGELFFCWCCCHCWFENKTPKRRLKSCCFLFLLNFKKRFFKHLHVQEKQTWKPYRVFYSLKSKGEPHRKCVRTCSLSVSQSEPGACIRIKHTNSSALWLFPARLSPLALALLLLWISRPHFPCLWLSTPNTAQLWVSFWPLLPVRREFYSHRWVVTFLVVLSSD